MAVEIVVGILCPTLVIDFIHCCICCILTIQTIKLFIVPEMTFKHH